MNGLTVALLVVAAAGAIANWWSRVGDDRRVEVVSKPSVMLALIGAAIALEPVDDAVRWWFVAGLVLSLAGDVFLLGDEKWFVAGLGSFLLGHVTYVAGFVAAEPWRWGGAVVGFVGVAALVAVAGRRIVAGAASRAPALRSPVSAYLVVISSMLVAASAVGDRWAIAGAAFFVVSDATLGWNRFVDSRPWMSPAIMVTYHLAQAGLVLSLV